jgi:two-component system chemotaxis sensor kinase CheA
MDDLLREFITETNESLDVVDVELVKFEQEPNNATILDNIFRLVHTIKGTCGFLGLPRLEGIAHAAETLMGKFRDGAPVTQEAVSLILTSIDQIKDILGDLEAAEGEEPEGDDSELIGQLEDMSAKADAAMASGGEAEAPAAEAAEETPPRKSTSKCRTRPWSGPCVRARSPSTNSNGLSARPRSREVAGRDRGGRRRRGSGRS